MIIQKVLNNNAVIARDDSGKTVVVCGKGIAFQRRPKEVLPEHSDNQIYVLKTDTITDHYQELLKELPIEILHLVDEIIQYGSHHLQKELNENLYLSLSDHLYTTLCRQKEGIELKNVLLWDIRRFYKKEFEVGLYALKTIKEQQQVTLSEDEAGFIAIHFVNASIDVSVQDTMELTKLIQDITNIVKRYFALEYDVEDIHYYRFITHVRFFAQRIMQGNLYEETEDEFIQLICRKYTNAYHCVERIDQFIQSNYQYPLSNEEKAYMTVHIHRVVYGSRK